MNTIPFTLIAVMVLFSGMAFAQETTKAESVKLTAAAPTTPQTPADAPPSTADKTPKTKTKSKKKPSEKPAEPPSHHIPDRPGSPTPSPKQ